MTIENIAFVGLPGPSHNYAALSPDNPAAQESGHKVSSPRDAALQVLDMVEILMRRGVRQAILPPLVRPNPNRLFKLGWNRHGLKASSPHELASFFAEVTKYSPQIVAAAFSASSMWTANAATMTPSSDARDRKLHFTPANMATSLHRNQEGEETHRLLKQIFPDPKKFVVHRPLESSLHFGDEGAANNLWFPGQGGNPGVNVFVYGRERFERHDPQRRYLPRQTQLASEAIARRHRIAPGSAVFIKQNPAAIDAGAFHNDVISVSHGPTYLLFYHEYAFADEEKALRDLSEAVRRSAGRDVQTLKVLNAEVSLEDAVKSYLFNSQIATDGLGNTVLGAPRQCRDMTNVFEYLTRLQTQKNNPFHDVMYADVTQSMRNGGGPACLRLRVVLTDEEQQAMHQEVLVTDGLLGALRGSIEKNYPAEAHAGMFVNANFVHACFEATHHIYEILELKPADPFTNPNIGRVLNLHR